MLIEIKDALYPITRIKRIRKNTSERPQLVYELEVGAVVEDFKTEKDRDKKYNEIKLGRKLLG